MKGHLLSLVTFLPLVGVLLLVAIRSEKKVLLRSVTLAVLVVDFALSLMLWFGFDSQIAGMQFVYRANWIPALNVFYHVGIDGISLLLVMLTTFLAPLIILGAWTAIDDKVKGFCISFLLLQTGMLGAFVSLDLILFYVFWELMLVPMYFIIGIWGGKRRIYAAIKLLLFTMFGGLLMLVAIIYLGLHYGTFNILELYTKNIAVSDQMWLFLFFGLAFIIKVPMFPFHTWLPDAHVEAPTAGSVVLAGVLLKLGTYGFLRFAMPLFPDALAVFTQPLMILAVIGIIYGALVAMVQPDIKKLVAYSSVSHLGFVMLGMLALNMQGLQGSIIQMVNHGLSTGALFLIVGMIYERRHTRMIADYGGIAKVIPVFSFFFMFMTLSSIGLPGLNGFVGEFLILLGTFNKAPLFAIVAGSGIILGAVYMLWMFRRVMFGPITHEENRKIKDLNSREVSILVILAVFIIWIGIKPGTFLNTTKASVQHFVQTVGKKVAQSEHYSHLKTKEQSRTKEVHRSLRLAKKGNLR